MRILVIGSGAREHALLRGLSQDPATTELHVAPGNAGLGSLATVHPDIKADDPEAVTALARELKVELVVIGPEIPLVAGVADALRTAGIAVFGPNKEASRIGPNWVVKDDGLAAGKGVVVTPDRAAARAHVDAVLEGGNPVLLESFLDGPEVSLFCLVDGETVVPLLPAQDHKRVFNNDEGPNTGGMGAYVPLPWLPEDGVQRIVDEVCVPVAREMVKRGCSYSGLLYAGIAWGAKGPAVVEFNCRFGDPETQAVLALLNTPLAGLLNSVATGTLAEHPELDWMNGYALTVVLASHNYPDTPRTGDVIRNADAENILHAGTAYNEAGELVSAGGRVLNVIGVGETLEAARDQAYTTIETIELDGSHYRTDIALPAVEGRITI